METIFALIFLLTNYFPSHLIILVITVQKKVAWYGNISSKNQTTLPNVNIVKKRWSMLETRQTSCNT